MADERLRRLDRRALDGDAQARRRALQERLRQGELKRVQLAAYLGDLDARAALSWDEVEPTELGDWIRGLARWGKEPCVRAARAAAELVRAECVQKQPSHVDVAQLLARVDAWLAAPSQALADATHESTLELEAALRRRLFAASGLHALVCVGKATWMAGIYAKQSARCAERVARRHDEQRVRAAVRSALLEWLAI